MEIDRFKDYIKLNENNLPLTFKKITIKEKDKQLLKPLKTTKSKFYRDNDYLIFEFYKAITQFL